MKVLISSLTIATAVATSIRAQEESASPAAEKKSYPEVPKEYEVGENTVSPDGRFAILYEVRDEDSNVDPGLPNLLVCFRLACERVGIQGSQAASRYLCRQQTELGRWAALDGRAAGRLESRYRQVRQSRFSTGQNQYSETGRLTGSEDRFAFRTRLARLRFAAVMSTLKQYPTPNVQVRGQKSDFVYFARLRKPSELSSVCRN